jgi:integrase
MPREQTGHTFHKGQSWFVRYCDDILQPDGSVKRKLVCKKLSVPYGGEYRTKLSVKPFVRELLAPLNSGVLNPQSTMSIADFIDKVYFPQFAAENLRTCTTKGYKHLWERHIRERIGKVALRDFRTVHGEKLLADIARQAKLRKNSLRHLKAFLSGVFRQAKRLGILDGINPMVEVSIPRAPEGEPTHAYSLDELKKMALVLDEPAKTAVLTAALSGLRQSELRGLRWQDFNGTQLSVNRSVWNSEVNETKNARSKASIPVVKALSDALEQHRQRMGQLAAPESPIFQAGNGKPLNFDNLANRTIIQALETCAVCDKAASKHKASDNHEYQRNEALPKWHGWHAFRRGLATTLHQLGVDDKTIQAILRHSNIGVTMNIYVKSVAESQVNAMDVLHAKMQNDLTCNDLATQPGRLVN